MGKCVARIIAMKLFIFDFGEVILNNVDTFHPMADYIGISYDEFMADFALYEMPLMDGYMAVDDYYRHLEAKFGIEIEGKPFADLFHPAANMEMLSYVQELRNRGYRCVAGSNTFKPHWDIIREMKENPLGCFDALYPSHEIHLSKPEKAFFRYICSRERAEYEETAFIDDRKDNIDAAASLGITTLEYSGMDKDGKAAAFFSRFLCND